MAISTDPPSSFTHLLAARLSLLLRPSATSSPATNQIGLRIDHLVCGVLPELNHQRQIVTSGTVIELALKDQEFIEVHLAQAIQPGDVDQIVESPETAAMEARILERQRNALPNHMHELEWARRRTEVVRQLEREGIRHRVVTQHGRGFQWR